MALFKKKTTRYLRPDGKQCPKGTPDASKVVCESKRWYGSFNDKGRTCQVPLLESEDASQTLLSLYHQLGAHLAGEVAKQLPADATSDKVFQVGIEVRDRVRDLANDPYARHHSRPIGEHVDDFERHLTSKNNSSEHVDQTCNRVKRIIEGCKFATWPDVEASTVQRWLADQRQAEAFGIQTSNYYLRDFKSFGNWMVHDRRTNQNPCEYLKPLNADVDDSRERRALPPWEFSLLIDAARKSKKLFRGLSGLDRTALYLAAAYSGLRVSELASLTPESVDLDGDPPTLIVKAAYSKRRRLDVQPIRQDVADELRTWLQSHDGTGKLWPRTWYLAAAKMLRRDLAEAREAWIEDARSDHERQAREQSDSLKYEDAAGRVFDFHSLRHQYISQLAAAGVHPKTAQTLARHSTIQLTMDRYTHLQVSDLTGALDQLPGIPTASKSDDNEPMKATGTDARDERLVAHKLHNPPPDERRIPGKSRHLVASTRHSAEPEDSEGEIEKTNKNKGLKVVRDNSNPTPDADCKSVIHRFESDRRLWL
ncbi:MAG: site-specific integrase [Planctomycetaceae bacterium]|nr:site-specific integrase [Planctomycetales bacterium]MCB9927177.1 site-specific integrase [Planctomycetaceae bacterium]